MSIRPRSATPDLTLTLATLLLLTTGLLLIYSSSAILAMGRYQDPFFFIKRQLIFAFLGVFVMVGLQQIDLDHMRRLSTPLLVLSLGLLAAVLIPGIGRSVGGARRWIAVGPLRFQPSELAKLALVLFAADRLARSIEEGKDWRGAVKPVLVAWALCAALIMAEPDFGSTALITVMLFTLFYVAGMPLKAFAWPAVMVGVLGVMAVLRSPYRMRRVEVFFDPWKDANGAGFQITHSMMAFGSGGLLGQGLGEGKQKLYYLPEPHTDFVFSTAGEEFGLFGCVTILFFFVLLLWRGMLISLKIRDTWGKLVSLGLTFLLGIQVLANLYVVLGLVPTKGTTLPFLSSGGSALLIDLAVIGLLLNFSKRIDERTHFS